MTPEQNAAALRKPFPPSMIGKLPKAGTTLDYVGHAAVTDRLLSVDPGWTWEPVAFADDGAPLIRYTGKEAELWIRLTVCGVTRLGVGTAPSTAFELSKQLVSDALRNAAMRFGVALDLWAKEDLSHPSEHAPEITARMADLSDDDRASLAKWWRQVKFPKVEQLTDDQAADVLRRLDALGSTDA